MIRADARKPGSRPAASPADEDSIGTGPLFQLGLWGGAAAACLLAVAIATWTEAGRTRLATAYAGLTGTTDTAQRAAVRERETEARQTTETLRRLAEDRDRLLARMTALERNYEDVTGSIGKLNAARPPAELPAVGSTPAPAASPPALAPAPVVSAPASTPAVAPSPVTSAVSAAVAAPEPQEPVTAKGEFGVDLGGGPTLASLRASWDRIRRNHASLLDGLRPVIAVRDGRGGQVELRLVVGPIANAANAAKLCAALAGAGLSCQPTVFEGQRLALR